MDIWFIVICSDLLAVLGGADKKRVRTKTALSCMHTCDTDVCPKIVIFLLRQDEGA